MWTIVPIRAEGEHQDRVLHLLGRGTYHVGRRGCEILLEKDKSISRRHAAIVVGPLPRSQLANTKFRPQIVIKDSSKYGTFLIGDNDTKLPEGVETELRDSTIVRFGLLHTNMRIMYLPIVLCTSRLSPQQLETLCENAAVIGAHVLPQFTEECTHLVMSQIMFSPKLFQALIVGAHIVTPQWLDAVRALERPECALPNPDACLPDYAQVAKEFMGEEAPHMSLLPNPARRTLFRQKRFVFLSASDFAACGMLVTMAGATAIDASNATIDRKFGAEYNGAYFVGPASNEGVSQIVNDHASRLKRAGYCVVDLDAILRSILLVSLNPHLTFSAHPNPSLLDGPAPHPSAGSVPATQSSVQSAALASANVIVASSDPEDEDDADAAYVQQLHQREMTDADIRSKLMLPSTVSGSVIVAYAELLRADAGLVLAARSADRADRAGFKRFKKQHVVSYQDTDGGHANGASVLMVPTTAHPSAIAGGMSQGSLEEEGGDADVDMAEPSKRPRRTGRR
jgi:nijmegen breakage syndrome protein 1